MKAGLYIRSAALVLAPAFSACGVDEGDFIRANLDLPDQREARVSVTPAVDMSGVVNEALANGLIIERVVINLADARLLGADPRLPPGGYPLLDGPRLVYAEGDGQVGIELPFPPEFLGQEDLAVYLRTEPSDELDGAAVQVTGRVAGGRSALTGMIDPEGDPAHEQGMIDPEGDPAHEQGMIDPEGDPAREQGMIDPEGDPAREQGMIDPEGDPAREEGMIDPEGDPARGDGTEQQRQGLSAEGATRLILVDKAGTEIVVSFRVHSRFDVVFGIRAESWLNEVTAGHEKAPTQGPDVEQSQEAMDQDGQIDTVVLESDAEAIEREVESSFGGPDEGRTSPGSEDIEGSDAYYGGEDVPIEDSLIREPFGF